MALPNIFGTTPQNTQRPGADLDTNFNVIGATGAVPCTASGTNAITLTPFANNITIGAYANYQLFSFQAVAGSTSAVTIQVGALAALPLYQSGGTLAAGNGALVSGQYYLVAYQLALNGGAGGFVLVGAVAPQVIILALGSGFNVTAGSTNFLGIGAVSTTETQCLVPFPLASGTITKMYVQSSAAPGGGQSSVITLRYNGADTPITCTISGAGQSSNNDVAHSQVATAGGNLDIKVVPTAGAVAANYQVTLEILGAAP